LTDAGGKNDNIYNVKEEKGHNVVWRHDQLWPRCLSEPIVTDL